jgi:hypothetical protein
MDWQQAVSLFLVFVTAALFIRGAMKKKARSASSADCGGSCANCSAHAPDIHQ